MQWYILVGKSIILGPVKQCFSMPLKEIAVTRLTCFQVMDNFS